MTKQLKFKVFTAIVTLIVGLSTLSCKESKEELTKHDLTRYVDLYIGTGDHGHVFMGANVPYGMVQLGPSSITGGWDWVSGYHYSDSIIFGFSHTHLNGTGIGDLQDIILTPVIGNIKLAKGVPDDPKSGYYSLFSHKN